MLKNNLNKLKQKYSSYGNLEQTSIKSMHSRINNVNADTYVNTNSNTNSHNNNNNCNYNHKSNSASKINYYPQSKTQNQQSKSKHKSKLESKFGSQKKLRMVMPVQSYGDGFYNNHKRAQKYEDDRGFVMRKLGLIEDRNVYTDHSDNSTAARTGNYFKSQELVNNRNCDKVEWGERMTAPLSSKVQKFVGNSNSNSKPSSGTYIGSDAGHETLPSYPSTTLNLNPTHAYTQSSQNNYDYRYIKTKPKLQVMTKTSPYFHMNYQQQQQQPVRMSNNVSNTNNNINSNMNINKAISKNQNGQTQINSPKTTINTAENITHRSIPHQLQQQTQQQITAYQQKLLKNLKFNQLFFCCACLRYIFVIQKSYHYPECSAPITLNKLSNRQKYKMGVQRMQLLMELASYTKCKNGEIRVIWDDVENGRVCGNYQKFCNNVNSNEQGNINRNYLQLNEIETAAHIIIQKLMLTDNKNDKNNTTNFTKQNGLLCGNNQY